MVLVDGVSELDVWALRSGVSNVRVILRVIARESSRWTDSDVVFAAWYINFDQWPFYQRSSGSTHVAAGSVRHLLLLGNGAWLLKQVLPTEFVNLFQLISRIQLSSRSLSKVTILQRQELRFVLKQLLALDQFAFQLGTLHERRTEMRELILYPNQLIRNLGCLDGASFQFQNIWTFDLWRMRRRVLALNFRFVSVRYLQKQGRAANIIICILDLTLMYAWQHQSRVVRRLISDFAEIHATIQPLAPLRSSLWFQEETVIIGCFVEAFSEILGIYVSLSLEQLWYIVRLP